MTLHLRCHPLQSSFTASIPKNALGKAPVGACLTPQVRCSAAQRTYNSTAERRSANYQRTIWSPDFLESLKKDHAPLDELYKSRAQKLEEEVRSMIGDENVQTPALLELVDRIEKLGLGYRFEMDITRALDGLVFSEGFRVRTEKSLHGTALSFRLLRQHGYQISQDVFKDFTDHNGEFMASISNDVKGMLSLYEASHLAFEGENLLDEAKAFTSKCLRNFKLSNINSDVSDLVSHALELPLHRRMQRLEARWYIESYSKREDTNEVLLELAKLDFNMVQSTHQRDLEDMSRWWKGMGLANKLSFARDRLMECFFWAVGMAFEPQFSNCRKGLTKVTALITTIDDIYDVYGSLEELELFTDAVERWDVDAVKNLPDYMKLCFLALYNTVNEMAYDTLKEQGVNSIPALTKAWADLCKAFLVEAKWNSNTHMPTFEDYFENAWKSVSGVLILVHAYFLLGHNVTSEGLECLVNFHGLLRWPSVIFRLCNDLATSPAELERGENVNSILCYMQETGLSEQLARKHISDLIEEAWKMLNKERAGGSPFAKPFVETAINLARISQCTYQHGDGHGAPDSKSKNRVLSVIIEPIPLSDIIRQLQ